MSFTYADVAKMIDHSILSPASTEDELKQGCHVALAYDVASVCLMPYYLRHCAKTLTGSTVKATTTIGFPHGGHATASKAAEAKIAMDDGADELDMVVNVSQVLSGNWDYVRDDIRAVLDITHERERKLKVIFENCYLADIHKIRLCEICSDLGVDWVKTSTGFGTGGATLEDLALMAGHVRIPVQVKASGGIRDLTMVLKARELGVTRCGTSRTTAILDDARKQLSLPPIDIAASAATGTY